jgi:hypothetical protein
MGLNALDNKLSIGAHAGRRLMITMRGIKDIRRILHTLSGAEYSIKFAGIRVLECRVTCYV